MNYRSLLLVSGLLILATGAPASLHESARPRPSYTFTVLRTAQIDEEEYAVYSALINDGLKEAQEQEKRKDADERVLVINDTPYLWKGFLESESKNFFDRLKNSSAELEPETVNDLEVKSNEAFRLERKFSVNIKYLLISDDQLDALFRGKEIGNWEGFYKKYPKSSGYLTLSRVGFNADKTQALVYKGWSCGGLCGGGGYTLLTKKRGVWVAGPGIGPTWVS